MFSSYLRVRFIGYAAMPLAISIPSSIISALAIRKIYAAYRRQRISLIRSCELDKLTSLPEHSQRRHARMASNRTTIRTPSPIFNPPAPQPMRRALINSRAVSNQHHMRHYHLPSRESYLDHRYKPSSTFHYSPAPLTDDLPSTPRQRWESQQAGRSSDAAPLEEDLEDSPSAAYRILSHKRKNSDASRLPMTNNSHVDEQATLDLRSSNALQAIWRLILYNLHVFFLHPS